MPWQQAPAPRHGNPTSANGVAIEGTDKTSLWPPRGFRNVYLTISTPLPSLLDICLFHWIYSFLSSSFPLPSLPLHLAKTPSHKLHGISSSRLLRGSANLCHFTLCVCCSITLAWLAPASVFGIRRTGSGGIPTKIIFLLKGYPATGFSTFHQNNGAIFRERRVGGWGMGGNSTRADYPR